MMRKLVQSVLLVAVLLAAACHGGGGGGAADAGPDTGTPDGQAVDAGDAGGAGERSLMYIGPHPDDEFYAAPLLGHYCVDQGWSCTFVVATEGEGGNCGLPQGCQPDLATVRRAEMQASAAIFGATLHHLDLGDNGKYEPYPGDVEEVLALWVNRAGGAEELVALFAHRIATAAPDVLYVMDPRHGHYCHPSHRALGEVVLQAVAELGEAAPETRLLAGRGVSGPGEFGFVPFVAEDPTLQHFDATTLSPALSAESWLFVLRVLQAHASQFPQAGDVDDSTFLGVSDANKRIYWVPLSGVVQDDPLYEDLCAPSTY